MCDTDVLRDGNFRGIHKDLSCQPVEAGGLLEVLIAFDSGYTDE
jgi:hypothetical protein